jgi:hypothetical protein
MHWKGVKFYWPTWPITKCCAGFGGVKIIIMIPVNKRVQHQVYRFTDVIRMSTVHFSFRNYRYYQTRQELSHNVRKNKNSMATTVHGSCKREEDSKDGGDNDNDETAMEIDNKVSTSEETMAPSTSSSRKRQRQNVGLKSIIKFVSATYGPCESLSTDSITSNSSVPDDVECLRRSRIPVTRDCAPFLRALLAQIRKLECDGTSQEVSERGHCGGVSFSTNVCGTFQAFIHLLGGGSGKLSMNAMFGDPCPGTSKRLTVQYAVTEINDSKDTSTTGGARTEIYHVSFAEHEPVKLRRCLAVLNRAEEPVDRYRRKFWSPSDVLNGEKPTLATTTQQVALPLVLPYLEVRDRIKCCIISRCWREIIKEWGVATVIDANDLGATCTEIGSGDSLNHSNFTRPWFRGLLAHSFTSLQSLFLSGFQQLEKDDLHPSLSHLTTLTTLDITRCTKLDDSTLKLIGQHLSKTLKVLYMKGLYNVTDDGLEAICNSCLHLEVLDVSQLTNITDQSGRTIQHLSMLRALFLRDNYQLTNTSLDAITQNCVKLRQLTIWGLIGIQSLRFSSINSYKLTFLNLWGCHNLGDGLSQALESMSLSSLILTECHQLTDDFIIAITKISGLQNLQHLHLRYLKRLSDTSLIAIANSFRSLHSLDLSFCSAISASGIYRLLNQCRNHLAELRLKSIRNLDVAYSSRQQTNERNDRRDHTGHWILNALRPIVHSNIHHALCVLDVRHCGGQPSVDQPYDKKDPFVVGMSKLNFAQTVPGFFSRPATIPVANIE